MSSSWKNLTVVRRDLVHYGLSYAYERKAQHEFELVNMSAPIDKIFVSLLAYGQPVGQWTSALNGLVHEVMLVCMDASTLTLSKATWLICSMRVVETNLSVWAQEECLRKSNRSIQVNWTSRLKHKYDKPFQPLCQREIAEER